MKKFAAFVAVFALLAFAAPVLAATNPFMDVPMNHWAYDAIGQLAAKGILSGYPDGLYKGNRSMTRYEAASAIARAVAYVDMTKASKQDVEMLKKLVIEFKDELDALGVRVDELEKDMAIFKSRLGGWRISGNMRLDIDYADSDFMDDSQGEVRQPRARMIIERWFGENEELHLYTRIQANDGGDIRDAENRNMVFDRFNVTMPFYWDSELTVGRAYHDWSRRFFFASSGPARYEVGSWFTDISMEQLQWRKNFALGELGFMIGHRSEAWDLAPNFAYNPNAATSATNPEGYSWEAWDLTLNFQGQFNEQIGFHLGGQFLIADDWDDRNTVDANNNPLYTTEGSWDNVITAWVGLDFYFMEGFAFRGTAFIQSVSVEDDYFDDNAININGWAKPDGGTAYQLALTVDQSVLKFTSLWLQYDYIPEGFFVRRGLANALILDGSITNGGDLPGMRQSVAWDDFSIIRVGATQQWNEKWSTWLYFANIDMDNFDDDFQNYGIGIEYAYNANVFFGLNYQFVGGGDDAGDFSNDYSKVRFTTQVVF